MVDPYLNCWSRPRGLVCLMITISPQLLMFTGTGAMKSLISAVNEEDERLFRKVLPKAVHVLAGKTTAAVRLIAASPNSPVDRVRGAFGAMGSVTLPGLTAPSASPAALRSTRLPQHGRLLLEKHWLVAPLVTQRSKPRVGEPLPLKS